MVWKKRNVRPLGVPLDELEHALVSALLRVSRKGDALGIRQGHLWTSVVVAPPERSEDTDEDVRAVVRIETALPDTFTGHLSQPGAVGSINRLATLGAVTLEGHGYVVASRLTVFERDEDWSRDLPLLLFAILATSDTQTAAGRQGMAGSDALADGSRWTEADLRLVQSHLFKLAPCNLSLGGLTAKFPLRRGVSSVAGDEHTAWWRLLTDWPHPEFGGGLLCKLDLPHWLSDQEHLARTLNDLNRMEMKGGGLPPHVGAWCPGDLGLNPAYTVFLPNGLHDVAGLVLKLSVWSYHRAQWADRVLATMNPDADQRLSNKSARVDRNR